jgi:hypothetical protein
MSVEGNRIAYHLSPELSQLRASGDFWIRYPETVELTRMPDEITLLPVAYFFAPLAWAFDRHFTLPALDERALHSFTAIRSYYRKVYPGLSWNGEVGALRTAIVEPAPSPDFEAAALFTGGVDSTYTALASKKSLLLINVWEARTHRSSPNSPYRSWIEQAATLAQQLGHRLAAAETNAWLVLDRNRVRQDLSGRHHFHNWWADVHFGMVLAGLTAPILYHHGIRRLLIAGGSMGERIALEGLALDGPAPADGTAATPYVDNEITLGPARAEHDVGGTRQAKIDHIVSHPAFESGPGWPLRVCLIAPYDSVANCGNCEKCLRTIGSIVVAGGDPRRFGFPDFDSRTLGTIQHRFERRRMPFSRTRALNWQGSQAAARERLSSRRSSTAEVSYLRWLSGFDFDAYLAVAPRRRPLGVLRRLTRVPLLPSLYLRTRMILARLSVRSGR